MKNTKLLLTAFIIVVLGSVASSQTYVEDAKLTSHFFKNKTTLFNIVASQNANTVKSNKISVQQIGDYNSAITVTKSQQSDINLNQFGDNNDIALIVSAKKIGEDVLQVGKNHSYTDLSNSRSQVHASNVQQFGSNQNLIRIGGQNSISDKMMVSMQGKDQTVIIRNLN
ncbi:hypothetical protein [Aequorivita marina]|uniref:hypothetical protein n=1 Tax=Aequorivita marina TaxID=3073654 RepID=UPI0028762EB7|nr:hypothetical protein [Aequorivita sp. S2608]MDS1299315.1 hypothetical protein [Aequorivita sp. S2608]